MCNNDRHLYLRFLEAEYKADLEYPVGVLGPHRASVKNTKEGSRSQLSKKRLRVANNKYH